MNFIQRHHVNKQIKLNLCEANTLCDSMQRCVTPANNIYWCNDLHLNSTDDDQENLNKLEHLTPAFLSNAKQLRDLYFETDKLCIEYPEMRPYVANEFNHRFQSLDNHISNLIESMQNLTIYKHVFILQKTVKELLIFLKAIKENKKSILDYQRCSDNCLSI